MTNVSFSTKRALTSQTDRNVCQAVAPVFTMCLSVYTLEIVISRNIYEYWQYPFLFKNDCAATKAHFKAKYP